MKVYSSYLPYERYKNNILDKEKYNNIPITIFNDFFEGSLHNEKELEENPINIMILNEPNQLFNHHNYIRKHWQEYSLILTWGDTVIQNCPNSRLFIHGETNLDKPYIIEYKNNPKRKYEVSYVSGVLDNLEGHKLRHRILENFYKGNVKIPSYFRRVLDDFNHKTGNRPGYDEVKIAKHGNPIEGEGKKELWNRNSMFHVAVENSRNINYYTDKIVDCFATKTIPIYWGAPNIGEFWNQDGIITFENEDELVSILNNLTEDDYFRRKEAIEENYQLAIKNGFFFDRLELTLDKLIEQNNLK